MKRLSGEQKGTRAPFVKIADEARAVSAELIGLSLVKLAERAMVGHLDFSHANPLGPPGRRRAFGRASRT